MEQIGRHRTKPKFRTLRRTATVLSVAGATTAAVLVPASATTTVSGGDPGTNPPVVRGTDPTITSDSGALTYFRQGTFAAGAGNVNNIAYAAQSLNGLKGLNLTGLLCRGNNPVGVNLSARQTINVTDPANNVVPPVAVSPARDVSLFGNGNPISPQPAPSDTNYIGDYPGTGGTHGMSVTLDLTGKPAGIYTVETTTYNTTRQRSTGNGGSLGPCVVGVPDPSHANKTVLTGPVVTHTTFEYRPWQNTFVDVFGGGKVFANTAPREFQFKLGAGTSTIASGDNGIMRLYSYPSTDPFVLPPTTCLNDPTSCLPAAATPCDPSTGCVPRIMTINQTAGLQKLQGTFDLETKAFIARANMNGISRTLVSTGAANDAQIGALLTKLKNAAAAKGYNLDSLLNTKIRLANGTQELDVTLLQGLQLAPSNAKGVQIVSDTTVQAGLILDIYMDSRAATCTTKSAGNFSTPPRFTPTVGYGLKVDKSDILPSVPSVGPLGAITSGPLFHITGKFAQGALRNTASAVLGIDSAANEPNGYPVWVEPFLSSPAHVNSPSTMDFLGTATWGASETNLGSSCLVFDLMIGTGVALYNNPLPVGFGTLLDPLYKPSPASEKLLNEINATVQSVVDQAATNPTVASVLTQILGALPV
jgi:hypothetical protein